MNKFYLRRKYVNFQMVDGEDIINHIHSFKLLLEELATVGVVYSEEDKVDTLLASLPKSYEVRVQSLTNTAGLTVEDVISKILHEDLRRKKSGTSTSHGDVPQALWTGKKSLENQRYSKLRNNGYSRNQASTHQGTSNYESRQGFSGSNSSQMGSFPSSSNSQKSSQLIHPNSQQPYKKKGLCNYCKIPGHYKKDCRKYLVDLESGKVFFHKSSSIPRRTAFVGVIRTTITNLTDPTLTNDWYLDSGATHHLTYHGEWFMDYSPVYPRKHVYLGDNTVQEIFGYGSIQIILVNGEERTLENVYHVPGLTQNLIFYSPNDKSRL